MEARFVVVGGAALVLQGSSYITYDIHLAYERTRENARRIVEAFRPFEPRPRGFAPKPPFVFDPQTLMTSTVLTLETSAGDIDRLASLKGLGNFAAVDAAAETMTFADGLTIRVLSIDGLIATKTAAGREKDKPGLIELAALKEARSMGKPPT